MSEKIVETSKRKNLKGGVNRLNLETTETFKNSEIRKMGLITLTCENIP